MVLIVENMLMAIENIIKKEYETANEYFNKAKK